VSRRVLLALAGLVLLALPWFLGGPVKRFAEFQESLGWPRVEATVVSVRAINFDGDRQSWGDDPQYELTIEFPFNGRRVRANLRHEHTVAVSFTDADAPKAGDRLEVLVNPSNPEEVYRGRGEVLVLALMVLAGVLGGLYLLWRSARTVSREGR
jgi:hypothetical protein